MGVEIPGGRPGVEETESDEQGVPIVDGKTDFGLVSYEPRETRNLAILYAIGPTMGSVEKSTRPKPPRSPSEGHGHSDFAAQGLGRSTVDLGKFHESPGADQDDQRTGWSLSISLDKFHGKSSCRLPQTNLEL